MNNDDDKQVDQLAPKSPEEPRRLLLGKRVVRNFQVRSGVQTGLESPEPPTSKLTLRTGIRTC